MTLTSIVAFALVAVASTAAPQDVAAPLPSTTLPLRLVGVAMDTKSSARSAALIECASPPEGRTTRLVAVGGHACEAAELQEVLQDAVVIRNLLTNRLERLALVKSGGVTPVPVRDEGADDQEPEAIPAPVVLPASKDVVRIELRKELLHRYMSSLPDVLSSALATPHHAPGGGPPSIDGFEVSRIKAGGIVEQLGVREGDVLLEFNGQPLTNLAAVTGLLTHVDALSGARMKVLRNGAPLTFVYDVR